jgi:hypothetical protein
MKQWQILARHKWVAGCTITESINLINDDIRRYTATIRGWRNFVIYEGDPRNIDTQRIMDKVLEIRNKMDVDETEAFAMKHRILE